MEIAPAYYSKNKNTVIIPFSMTITNVCTHTKMTDLKVMEITSAYYSINKNTVIIPFSMTITNVCTHPKMTNCVLCPKCLWLSLINLSPII